MAIMSQVIANGLINQNNQKIRGDIKMSNNDWTKYLQINCRTCAHATPREDSTWHCARWDAEIPQANQPDGCRAHVLHPDLVPWTLEGGDGVNATYRVGGHAVTNGEGGASSWEIIAHA